MEILTNESHLKKEIILLLLSSCGKHNKTRHTIFVRLNINYIIISLFLTNSVILPINTNYYRLQNVFEFHPWIY